MNKFFDKLFLPLVLLASLALMLLGLRQFYRAAYPLGYQSIVEPMADTFQWVRYRLGEEGAAGSDLLYDPWENVRYGCTNLSLLLREFGGEDTALAAYHAGRGSVNRWLGDSRYSDDGDRLSTIPYRDTDAYVKKVLDTRDLYRRLYPHLGRGPATTTKEET